jgi:hypothetical protein
MFHLIFSCIYHGLTLEAAANADHFFAYGVEQHPLATQSLTKYRIFYTVIYPATPLPRKLRHANQIRALDYLNILSIHQIIRIFS